MRTLVTDDLRKTLRALAEKPQWLAWKAGPKDPRTGKFSKYPFNIYTGKNATGSHEDGAYLENCGTLDQAQAGIKKYNLDGLGFVVTRQDSIVAVDIDRCLEGGEITPGVKQIVECFDSYTEISPSGKGLRIFCFGKLPKGAISNPPGTPYEIYDCNKFLTVTGNVYGELRPVKENQEAVNWFCENVTGFHGDGSKGSNDDRPKAESVLKGVPEGQRDEWLFRYACRLRAKNMGREEAETLVSIAARNCEPPFPTQEALSKVDQAWKNYKPGETGATYGKIPKVCLVRAADIKPEPINWIWIGWLAAGKVHILAGISGHGKSTLSFAFAGTISIGGRWPDGTLAPVGDVIIWSGEDDPADTIVPRLIANGADLTRVHIVQGVVADGEKRNFDPSNDIPILRQAMAGKNVKLVIIDPIVSAVSGDSHKNAEVRRSLQPIVDLAAEMDCAVYGITHFTKGTTGKDPIERVTSSLAFGALTRLVTVAMKLPDDGNHPKGARLLARTKSNIGPDGGGFHYFIEVVPVSGYPAIKNTRVLWGQSIEGTARELLAMAEKVAPNNDKTSEAEAWLNEVLAGGPMDAEGLIAEAVRKGMTRTTLQRAKGRLKIKSTKAGFAGRWGWCLPKNSAESFIQHEAESSGPKHTQHIDSVEDSAKIPNSRNPSTAGIFAEDKKAPEDSNPRNLRSGHVNSVSYDRFSPENSVAQGVGIVGASDGIFEDTQNGEPQKWEAEL